MKTLPFSFVVIAAFVLTSCQPKSNSNPSERLISMASSHSGLEGSNDYLQSPYVAAGDRLYMVGHQDGSFPDLGWHIDGEMGGIWDHPIKLMDGFSMVVTEGINSWVLDSASSFHNLPFGNIHRFARQDLKVERFQFVPESTEGLIVEVRIENTAATEKVIEFSFTGHVDLRPTWLAERQEIEDGTDEGRFDDSRQAYVAKDVNNPWFVVFGGTNGFEPSAKNHAISRKGKGKDFSLSREFEIEANDEAIFQFYISGSYESKAKALATFDKLSTKPVELLEAKIQKYNNVRTTNLLATNDPGVDQMFQWIKYNTQWLVRDVPEVGRGVSAGIPDYPWWFGTDGAYIIQGLLSAGMHEEALHTIDLIMDLSRKENGNGKIVHEVSSNGVVFNPGNLNTTPTFIIALWKAYEWTGDPRIIEEYYDDIMQGIAWIDSMDKDQNGYPDGAGMMEIHGLHSEMIDVVAYLAKAYQAVSNFAAIKNDLETSRKYAKMSKDLTHKINTEWWVKEAGSYADFRSSKVEALELIDAALIRADTINKPWSVEELEETKKAAENAAEKLQGFVVHHNWVVNTPMEVGLAYFYQAEEALVTAKKYQNRFGMFVTGIDRDEEQEKASKWKAFSYVGAVMTLPTGVQAIGEANYGNSDGALEYLKMLENSFSYALPGSMYEVSPDFGMIAQGWNIYAVAVPVVDYFFGIQPKAFSELIVIKPQMPSSWNEAKLQNIKIGENELSISFTREGDEEKYEINQKLDWDIQFDGTNKQTATINQTP